MRYVEFQEINYNIMYDKHNVKKIYMARNEFTLLDNSV